MYMKLYEDWLAETYIVTFVQLDVHIWSIVGTAGCALKREFFMLAQQCIKAN
jgi:hypothetical protein